MKFPQITLTPDMTKEEMMVVTNENFTRIRNSREIINRTPSSATDVGVTGTIVWDSDYIYVCVDTNTWKRVAIATW